MILLIAALIIVAIFIGNYSPNTFLSIWDTIHTEFNFPLDIKRNFFSIWQEYRGLGLVDGMAHAADLPRQLFLYPFQFILPMASIRYFYHFLMLAVGFFGALFFFRQIVFNKNDNFESKIAAFTGALFYLLNLGTIQYFLVPFESFSTFWGMFPWLMYVLISCLKNPTRKNYFFLVVVNLLAAPAFYIQTIFLVYIMIVFSIVLVNNFFAERKLNIFLPVKIISLILAIQSFWLLPSLYFLKNDSSRPRQAHINYMSSENTLLQNKRRGTLSDFLILRGYYFDFVEESGYMMESWRQHLDRIDVSNAFYLLSAIGIGGLFVRSRVRKYFLPVYFLSALALLSDTFPVGLIQDYLRRLLPFWDQVFRSPFTKFIVPAAFSLAVFFASCVYSLLEKFRKLEYRYVKFYQTLISVFILLIFAFQSYPVFNGNLFSTASKIHIPIEYFELFNFFSNKNPNERIATFPQQTYWGWSFYSWGYRGSGFLWQGLPQPVLDRAFDVWSNYNENYYWELSHALYSRNKSLFEKVLQKYDVGWLIVDTNVISFSSSKVPFFEKTENLLQDSEIISLARTFGKIRVYKVTQKSLADNYISLLVNPPQVLPVYRFNQYDRGFEEYENYVSDLSSADKKLPFTAYYPFRSLFTGRLQEEKEFKLKEEDDYFVFSASVPPFPTGGKLIIPKYTNEDFIEINTNDLANPDSKYPEIYLDDKLIKSEQNDNELVLNFSSGKNMLLTVKVPKIYGMFSYENITNNDLEENLAYDCDTLRGGELANDVIEENGKKFLRITSLNTNGCLNYELWEFSHKFAYLLNIDHRHLKGYPLLIGINNRSSSRADQETLLPKYSGNNNLGGLIRSSFVIPPMEEYARGYTMRFENNSIGRNETVNDLGKMTVNPIPYRLLTGIKIITGNYTGKTNLIDPDNIDVIHPNPNVYEISILNPVSLQVANDNILVLSQSYHRDWHAYKINCDDNSLFCKMKKLFPFVYFPELKNHILVNNWSNGWMLPRPKADPASRETTVIIIFLPQYLQYFGYAVSILTVTTVFMGVLSIRKKHVN